MPDNWFQKKEIVEEAFQRYYKSNGLPVIHETVGMEHPWSYRNKAQLQVGTIDGKLITGLYAAGTHQLIDISDCPIQHPKTNEIIKKTREVLQDLKIPAYHERKRTGVISDHSCPRWISDTGYSTNLSNSN